MQLFAKINGAKKEKEDLVDEKGQEVAMSQARRNSLGQGQRYTYRVLQTIQMKAILLWVWAEGADLGRAKTAPKFKYEI